MYSFKCINIVFLRKCNVFKLTYASSLASSQVLIVLQAELCTQREIVLKQLSGIIEYFSFGCLTFSRLTHIVVFMTLFGLNDGMCMFCCRRCYCYYYSFINVLDLDEKLFIWLVYLKFFSSGKFYARLQFVNPSQDVIPLPSSLP